MKKSNYLLVLALGASTLTYTQVGIGTSSPSNALDIETTGPAVDINDTGGGDPEINFQISGTTTFSIGIDNSDSDKLKIGTTAPDASTSVTIDASQNVGIGNTSPTAKLDVDGSAIFNESGAAVDFKIEGDTDTELFYVDGSADRVGIGTSSPSSIFHVDGGNSTFTNGILSFDTDGDNDWAGIAELNGGLALSGRSTATSFPHLFVGQDGEIGVNTTSPASGLDVQTSMGLAYATVTSATTLNQTHNVVLASDASGDFTITLPAAASNSGKVYYIKKTNSSENTITIDGNSTETIDGLTTIELYVQYDAIRIVCDGSNWHIIADERIPHLCVLSRSTAQTITSGSNNTVDLNSETYDVGGIGDPTTNYRIDIKRTGKYSITSAATMNLGDGDKLIVKIYINGSESGYNTNFLGAAGWQSSGSTIIRSLTAGDYVELVLFHDYGSDVNTLTTSTVRPTLSVSEIR